MGEAMPTKSLYLFAETVRRKIVHEAAKPEPSLRQLVSHANIFDLLRLKLEAGALGHATTATSIRQEENEQYSDSDSDDDSDSSSDSDDDFDVENGETELFYFVRHSDLGSLGVATPHDKSGR